MNKDQSIGPIKQQFTAALRQTGQGAYARREPRDGVRDALQAVAAALRRFVTQESQHTEAWVMLAETEGALLNYQAATEAIDHAIRLAGREQGQLLLKKRFSFLTEEKFWQSIRLSSMELRDLGMYLASVGVDEAMPASAGLQFTRQWIEERGTESRLILEGLRENGAFSDSQVYSLCLRG